MSTNFLMSTICVACVVILTEARVYGNYTGDILLAGFFPVHHRVSVSGPTLGNSGVCEGIQTEDGIQAMEAFFFTLDKIRADKDFLPGFTLGAVVLDSCDDDTHALEQAVDLIRVLMTRDDDSNMPYREECNPNATTEHDPFWQVVGVVGGRSSAVSSQLASLFKLFQLPQVSYLSTSPDLSNPERFPFFKRTVPSDTYQARVMVKLLREFNWTYVSVIYEDSNYGIKGYAELERAANDNGVCFAYIKRIDFNEATWGDSDYEEIINGMTEKDRSKVAVLWADFPRARELFQAANRLNKIDIVWIGSDGWSGRKVPVDGLRNVVRDAITVQPLADTLGEFDAYFTNLHPERNLRNPWFTQYWEHTFNCTFTKIKGETSSGIHDNGKTGKDGQFAKQCTGKEKINTDSGYKQQLSLHFISDAAYAFAHALSALQKAACGEKPGICENMKPSNISGADLLQRLADVAFTSASKDEFKFINGMDGPSRYTIMSYRELQPKNFEWVTAGTYYGGSGDEGTLYLERAFRDIMSSYPPSSCSVPCSAQQARTYVKGERCCWVCTNCTEWAVVISISDDVNEECLVCPNGMEPSANRTWCINMEASFMNHTNPWAIASMSLAILLICIGTFVTIVFILYYKTPVIKASGRELSLILISVIMVSYLSTFIFVAKPSVASCSLTRILLGLGYTGIYTCILAKASRISRIFNDGAGSPKRARMTSPKSQLLIVVLLFLVEVLVLAVWFSASPTNTKHIFPDRATRLLVCTGSEDASYLIALIYPFMLMLFCLVYAFKTRKTPDGFNETRLIAFTSYTTVVIWLAFVPLYFINQFNNEVRITTLCVSLSMNATVALLCLLSPKVYICLFRPEKNTREAVMTRSHSALSSSSMPNNIGDLSQPRDSPGGTHQTSRRTASLPTNQAWPMGVVNPANTNSLNQFTMASTEKDSSLKKCSHKNSSTQTTFSVEYYAPIYEVSEDEMKDEETESKNIKTSKHDIKTRKLEDCNDNTEHGETLQPWSGFVDIDDVTLEFPNSSPSPHRGNFGQFKVQFSRQVSINKIKELSSADGDSSTT